MTATHANADQAMPSRQRSRWIIVVALVAVFVALPGRGLAHDGAEGEDVGFARLTAVQTNGVVTVELRISESDACDRFAARGIAAQRASLTVTGAVGTLASCVLGGQIILTESGRWTMTYNLAYDDQPIDMTMPVGMSDETMTFERAEWLHAPFPPHDDHLPQWLIIIIYVVIGLLSAALVELFRRRRASPATGKSVPSAVRDPSPSSE